MADEIFHRHIEPILAPHDRGKYLAISIDSENYEINSNEHAAMTRLLDREPHANIWLLRIGEPATYRIR